MKDQIVEELHRMREQRAKEFKHDLSAMFEDLRRSEEESKARGAIFVTPKRRKAVDLRVLAKTARAIIAATGEEPWHDPIVEEIHKIRQEHAKDPKVCQPVKRKTRRKTSAA